MPTKTQREREEAQRQEKLDRIQEQVEEGSLVIRQMTDAERARFTKQRKSTDAEGTTKRRDRRTRTRSAARPLPPARRS
jgi:hypothetical protein